MAFAGDPGKAEGPGWVERARYLMGTRCELRAFGPLAATEVAVVRALDRIAALEAVMTTWNPEGELARINSRLADLPQSGELALSEDLARALDAAREWQRRTRGAFDPSLGSLGEAWGLKTGGRIPGPEERRAARPQSPQPGYAIDAESRLLVAQRPNLRFDLGGIGKGIALDEAAIVLLDAGIEAALFNFGGQVLALGPPPGADAWIIELADPEDRGRPYATLPLRSGSVATSGGSERALAAGGRRYSHLLDPRTGSALEPRGTVVVRAKTATAADALSTALAVAGATRGAGFLGPGAFALWMTPAPGPSAAAGNEEKDHATQQAEHENTSGDPRDDPDSRGHGEPRHGDSDG